MKKFSLLICALLILTCLSACQLPQSLRLDIQSEPPSSAPLRMVEQVRIMLQPDATSGRVYQMQDTLNPLMRLLREMDYNQPVRDDEALDRSKSYLSFSIQYASGERQSYRLLSHQYLKVGSERWYEISRDDALALTRFLMDHESDSVFIPDPDNPAPVSLIESAAEK